MSKAVAAALRDMGHRNGLIVARNEAKGRPLAERYGVSWAASEDGFPAAPIVNATPLGMKGPDAEALAFSQRVVAAADVVFDVVALPVETPLMQFALRDGKRRISGADVAVPQALEQFALYTGIRPGPELVEEAATFARTAS